MERKLAAILVVDVVGYSALMERDEAGTFDRLLASRNELFEPEIKKRRGRIFKLTGDGPGRVQQRSGRGGVRSVAAARTCRAQRVRG